MEQFGGAVEFGRSIIREEARGLSALAAALDSSFEEAAELILAAPGRVVVSGLGKSGHAARKIAATFASTGTPASFLHLSDASHGDLGMFAPGDLALIISNSGETSELKPVLEFLAEHDVPVVALTSDGTSTLASAARVLLLIPAAPEVGPGSIAPTTSVLMALALGDALAMAVMHLRGFDQNHFARLHPAGALGLALRPVASVMHRDGSMPLVTHDTWMSEAVVEMTVKRLGIVGVLGDEGRLVGVVTDGDLRRSLDRLSSARAGDLMTSDPKTVPPDAAVRDVLALMREHKITSVFVVDEHSRSRPLGVVHIHDLTTVLDRATASAA